MKPPFLLIQILKFLYPLVRNDERIKALWIVLLSLIISGMELTLAVAFASLAQVLTPSVSHSASILIDSLSYLASILWTDLEQGHALILACLATLVVLLFIRAGLQLFYQWQLGSFAEGLGMNSRLKVFKFYQHAPSLWLHESGLAELNFNITASTTIATITSQTLHLLSNTLILSFLLLGFLFSNHQQSILFIILLCLIAGTIVGFLRKLIKQNAQKLVAYELEIAQLSHDTLYGVKALRLAQRESLFFERFSQALHSLLKTKVSQTLLSRLPSLSLELIGFSSLFICALLYTYLEAFPLVTLSSTLALLAAIAWRALPVINQSLNAYTALRLNLPYLERVKDLFELQHKFQEQKLMLLPNEDHSRSKPSLGSSLDYEELIQFKNLSFKYPNRNHWVLKDSNLNIQRGQKIAVIGDSGAGKSTFAQLLTGLLKTDYGQILIDGQELNLQGLSTWLPQLGYVPQKSHLFNLSLQENIALRDLGNRPNFQKVQECCQQAHIEFIDELEQGVHTLLGENAYSLSGGQIQRVAIARALYHSPKLLILDEACNAIDSSTEARIIKTLLAKPTLTLIFISHRLESCQNFDEIIWIKEGSIIQKGPAPQVLAEYKKYLKHPKSSAQKREALS